MNLLADPGLFTKKPPSAAVTAEESESKLSLLAFGFLSATARREYKSKNKMPRKITPRNFKILKTLETSLG
ncbi:MAG: hypothetical protein ALECFALPRED_010567 [Alectoria fallacina]|uniref:Uncharacterized protein n=1 Tax=Alectoria fallacina TaxID=1903189 RepID=A0A8H3F8K8_9LECA|nr:MAG: hypothetical protein ALECFALPRED_010567 [Alectoria fallacina]